eukprot:CAMPEP_0177787642 /NCGR_PEP_ID=MMETSP0491_2-20121128/21624_1 /TAXON_ID=63592 /ORGANISM="Tetraselmis chuii, Strain PLY429" /LENGTH=106 /DNA_ID=CAMNT_0019309051 /DNA_START=308 /DNA_END=627 /DNA_ORIENTATION=-
MRGIRQAAQHVLPILLPWAVLYVPEPRARKRGDSPEPRVKVATPRDARSVASARRAQGMAAMSPPVTAARQGGPPTGGSARSVARVVRRSSSTCCSSFTLLTTDTE